MTFYPEEYWSEVAQRISKRQKNKHLECISPLSLYRNNEFVKLLRSINFTDKSVLEVGCGPGGNLIEVLKNNPQKLYAADISADMLSLARENVKNQDVQFIKTNGRELPFSNSKFDIVFTASVLQYISDEILMQSLLREMCRVSKDRIILFEKTSTVLKADKHSMARPVGYYVNICKNMGFEVEKVSYLNTLFSDKINQSISSLLNPSRKYAEKVSSSVEVIQKITLPVTSLFDKFASSQDYAMIEMTRK